MTVWKRIRQKIKERKGSSMLLVVCLFLVLCVLGINLLNAANANVSNTALEFEKEQVMLYAGSIYEIVNRMIENGEFSDSLGQLPDKVSTVDTMAFKDGENKDIGVEIQFLKGEMPIETKLDMTYQNAEGTEQTLTIVTTYSTTGVPGKYVRESCKGLVDHVK